MGGGGMSESDFWWTLPRLAVVIITAFEGAKALLCWLYSHLQWI
jgi:hypothetical protein